LRRPADLPDVLRGVPGAARDPSPRGPQVHDDPADRPGRARHGRRCPRDRRERVDPQPLAGSGLPHQGGGVDAQGGDRPDGPRRHRPRRRHLPLPGPLKDGPTMTHFPLLTVTLLLPLAGALIIGVIPKEATRLIRTAALLSTLVTFVTSLFIVFHFNASVAGPQLEDQARWIPQAAATLHLGVDG